MFPNDQKRHSRLGQTDIKNLVGSRELKGCVVAFGPRRRDVHVERHFVPRLAIDIVAGPNGNRQTGGNGKYNGGDGNPRPRRRTRRR